MNGYINPELNTAEAIAFDDYLSENLTESPEFYLQEHGTYAWEGTTIPAREEWKKIAQEINDTKSHTKQYLRMFNK